VPLSHRHWEQARDYAFGCPDGEWAARLDHKAWGKKHNMILYFTQFDSGEKRWLSVFWNDDFRPRDGGFDFKSEGSKGDLFTLTTIRNPKTGNPVFQSARRFAQTRPTKIMFRSKGFMIGENASFGRECSACKEISTVYAVYLLSGYERFVAMNNMAKLPFELSVAISRTRLKPHRGTGIVEY
jgi:hypothetical protein